MTKRARNKDLLYLLLLVTVLAGIPLAIHAYNNHLWQTETNGGARVFALTAHSRLGWIPGSVSGYEAITLYNEEQPGQKLELRVKQGDLVALKLTSSDVIHGFSMKDFGIFIEDGIRPGKVTLVTFRADRVGTFTFSCNIICGDEHKNMQGTLIVTA
ncbi:MAG: hypothetical protein JSU72_07285 [Deltaproteobacteria bacterium]|nr:MAG: hypothetical protein JSU72_07285 [Deltaproteobacteria bacterium]